MVLKSNVSRFWVFDDRRSQYLARQEVAHSHCAGSVSIMSFLLVLEMPTALFVGSDSVKLLANGNLCTDVVLTAVDRHPIEIDGGCTLDIHAKERESERDQLSRV
jgi:hypothetical protein